MYIIFIKGRAKVSNNDGPVIDPTLLKQLNGVTYEQGTFTEFLADGGDYSISRKIKRDGGMYFSYKAGEMTVSVTTSYWSKKPLSEKELKSLANYTMIQWSDGIGEGLESENTFLGGLRVQCLLDSDIDERPYPKIEVFEDD
jgi:hypothetical protein